ncbi:MAG: type VI secretion lipoprotein TssJ [Acidovorax sp.]|jgi:predicted component of type VI protein secretion system|nr:type VI secretion lipoprotein TssJ [Acidovorax sp.]
MTSVYFTRSLLLATTLLLLQGCGVFRNPVDIPADGMRAIRRDRVVNVTLMGGTALNPGRGAATRPVQVCVYLVANENWNPGSWLEEKKCSSSSLDSHLFAAERRLLSSEQAQQVTLKMPSDKDGWVLVDADFGSPAPQGYESLRLKTNSGEFSFHVVVLNGTRIVDGMVLRKPTTPAPPAPLSKRR